MGLGDKASAIITRGRDIEEFIKFRNPVHAMIIHGTGRPGDFAPGSISDLGTSYNLITNGGKDYVADTLGGKAGFGVTSTIATACDATSITGTTSPFSASALIGQIVIAEETTNAPVWGTIVSNTTGVLTIDAWKNGDGTTGTTPAATANFQVLPGGGMARYMALTENSGAANATDAALTGEITSGGCGRALATYAHTPGTNTYTLVKAFSVTGTFPAIHKMGLFFVSTASVGPMIFETVLNADASVVNGDTLTITETVTLT
jgi:hypothetical protein